ncbi:hypothetical protein EUX98_g4148 [Antrodiella citrinella]|uniref:Uncharacterized protein n=1 Tax=Antrodiella citrinella TaxID=2447956 RepID=A0A4S4MXJ1_9APHY|nr:hypothetical protein EUX98_g4148 [Antrodiella citrinella]
MSDLSPVLGRLEAAADFLRQARQLALDSQTAENACCCRRVRQNIIPVFRLPNEILSGTFLLYKAAMYAEQASCTHGRPDPLAWIRISHVCQHWRSVALSTPQLWTDFHVVGQDPQFVMEMLALSKRMSVTVKAELYKGRNPQPIQALLAEIHRVESLELELAPPVNRLLESAAPSVAPRLRCLTLCSTDKDSLTVTPMPTVFNDCEFPVLQELTVSGYRLQWSSNILAPTLTRLKVTCWGRYAAPVAAILQALALMPLLENLDLSGCVTPFPLAEQEALLSMAIKPVTLGRLTQLCMTTTSIFMTTLLDSLIIPATCKISLCLRSTSIVGNTSLEPLSNAILSKLSGKTTIGSTTPFRTLVICKEPPTTVVVALWRDVLPVNGLNEQHPDLPPPDLRISIMLYPVSVDDVLHMCGLLPLWDIEVLSIAPGQMEEKNVLAHLPSDGAETHYGADHR